MYLCKRVISRWGLCLSAVAIALSLGCARRDIVLRPDDEFGGRNNFRGSGAAKDIELLRWAQITSEKIQEVKKIMERAVGVGPVPNCSHRENSATSEATVTVTFTECSEDRGGVTAAGSWSEEFTTTDTHLALLPRQRQLTITGAKTPAVSLSLKDTTTLWAHIRSSDRGEKIYQITFSDEMHVGTFEVDDRVWITSIVGLARQRADGRITALENLTVQFYELDSNKQFQGGLSWDGRLDLDPTCIQPQGTINSTALKSDGTVHGKGRVEFRGARGFSDGISKMFNAKFPCDQSAMLYYVPMLIKGADERNPDTGSKR